MRTKPLTFASVRALASQLCIFLCAFSFLSPGMAADAWTRQAQSHRTAVQTPPSPLASLRLQGVASIGNHETAYFTDTSTGAIISLRVGDSLWQGYTLVRIANGSDYLHCQAVISDGGKHYEIGVEDFMQVNAVPPVSDDQGELEEESDPVVRVAVRPWVDPKGES